LGQLSANGNVFLINPNGILFGPTATVNVGGLVASTLSITDQDFLSGNYNFFQEEGKELAAVVNQGQIHVTDAGYAVLVAPTVINEGTIVARAGNVVLASGEQATLDLDGRDLVHFALDGKVSDGIVLLAPGMMSETIAQTLGVDSARRADKLVQMADGSVQMVNSSGTLVQAGLVSADGRDGVDAGSVLLDSADYTLLTEGSVTTASGQGADSAGGEVFVLSDMSDDVRGLTTVQEGALIAASGGQISGDAGFAEVSGDQVQLRGDVDLTRTSGKGGRLVLDPGTVFIVDDSFSIPVDGNTYYTDLFIEGQLNSGTDVDIYSTGESIQSNVRGTSGGMDTGVQAVLGNGRLTYNTFSANPVTMETGSFIDLGNDDYDILGFLDLFAATDVTIGASNITTGLGFMATAQGGTLTIDGATIDTRGTPNVDFDGASVYLNAGTLIDIDNTSIFFESEIGTGQTLALTTFTGNIEINDSNFVSDFLGSDYFSDIVITSAGSVNIVDTNMRAEDISITSGFDAGITQTVTGNTIFETENNFTASASGTGSGFVSLDNIDAGGTVDIDGDTVDLQDATVTGNQIFIDSAAEINVFDADVLADTGIDRVISINAGTTIDGNPDSLFKALQAPTIILGAGTGSIDVAIDTPTLTDLTVSAAGSITIKESGDSTNSQGFNLVRGAGNVAVQSTTGNVEIETSGLVGLGNGDPGGDIATESIISAPSGSVRIKADRILDQTSTGAMAGGLEIESGGTVILDGENGIGSFTGDRWIDIQATELIASAIGAGAPIRVVSTDDLNTIDLTINGGRVFVTDNSGGVLQNQQIGGNGPNVLSLSPGTAPLSTSALAGVTLLRVTSLDDLFLHNFDVAATQQVVLSVTGTNSIFNGDATNSGLPNVTVAGGGDGFIALNAGQDIGTQAAPVSIESEHVLVGADGMTSNIFLDLRIPSGSAVPITLEGIEPDLINAPLPMNPFSPSGIGVSLDQGDVVLDVTGDIFLPGGILTGGNIAIDAGTTGNIDLNTSPLDATTIVIQAGSLSNALNIFATSLGLSIDAGHGADGSPAGISNVQNIALGSDAGASYYLQLNTELQDDVRIVDSVQVRNQTVSGNQANNLYLENVQGNIFVEAPVSVVDEATLFASDNAPLVDVHINDQVSAGNRIKVEATGDITQGGSGVLDSTNVVLKAGGNIGESSNDQLTSASTLSVSAGDSAFVRNGGPALTIQSDTDVPVVGAANDFRVINEGDSLTVSTDINATNIGLATGTNTEIGAQALGGDIILNNSVIASQNLVILAGGTGNIIQNGGILQADKMGLGSNGTVGTPGNGIILLNTNELALFSLTNQLNPDPPPTPVAQVNSVGLTVNQGTADPPPPDPDPDPDPNPDPGTPTTPEVPDGSIVVDVVLEPTGLEQQFEEEIVDGNVFAQNNVTLVDEYVLELIYGDSYWDGIFDPTYIPGGWWDDDDFLKRKFRRRSRK
ncbi:MAG: filamentous hemagglutinin N-terminal domain-containing protein, partial [Candidatus Eremiobacteraeota bacterium]|nr:filamentous hemagglutinin N-terminal domain-containing protein [Candidatus Eremiobacteraeota bacterium]